jgi:hypothetical protein
MLLSIGFSVPLVFAEGASTDTPFVVDLYERVSFLDDLNRQISDLPDGAKVRLRVKPLTPSSITVQTSITLMNESEAARGTTCPVASQITSRVPIPQAAYRMRVCHGRRTDCRPALPLESTYARCGHRRRRNTHPIRAS